MKSLKTFFKAVINFSLSTQQPVKSMRVVIPLALGLLLLASPAQSATVTWNSAGATTTSWALGSNWIGGVAPVAGDDVIVTADGTFDPTNNSAYTGISLNSLTLTGSTSLSLSSNLQVGAGGVYNNMASSSLFLQGVNLTADSTWGGTRTIFVSGASAVTGSKMIWDGGSAAMRFDFNSPAWSAGMDIRGVMNMGGNFVAGTTITPWGTGTLSMINQNVAASAAVSPSLGLAAAAGNNSFANGNTLANNIDLQVEGGRTSNFTIQQINDAAAGVPHFYTLTGVISGSTTTGRTLTFGNAHGSPTTTRATYTLTNANTYAAGTTVGSNTTLQLGDGTTGRDGTITSGTVNLSAATSALIYNRFGSTSYSGVISGSGSVTMTGSGTQSLSGPNTYSGTTTVSAGTLLVNSTHTGAGAYTVGAAGTLGGTGTITTASNASIVFADGASLSPGNSTLSGDATASDFTFALGTGVLDVSAMNTGGKFEFRLGTDSDKIILTTGTLSIGTLNSSEFAFTQGTGFGLGSYTLFDTASTITFTSLDTSSFSLGGGYTGALAFANSNQDIVLNVVPEPSAVALLGLGLLGLITFRRRRHA